MDVIGEAYGRGKMVGVGDECCIEVEQIAHQYRKEYRTIFAVAVGVVERLVPEERAFVTELLVVGLVFESRLHEIEKHVCGFGLALVGNGVAKYGVELSLQPVAERCVRIHVPVVGEGIAVVEFEQVFVGIGRDCDLRVAFGLELASGGRLDGEFGLRLHVERRELLARERYVADIEGAALEAAVENVVTAVVAPDERIAPYLVFGGHEYRQPVVGTRHADLVSRLREYVGLHDSGVVALAAAVCFGKTTGEGQVCPVAQVHGAAQLQAVGNGGIETAVAKLLPHVGHIIFVVTAQTSRIASIDPDGAGSAVEIECHLAQRRR